MLRHRLSKISKAALLALCALLVGGMFNSCQDHFDEYTYDDGDQPAWLGESVYSFLRNNSSGHTYHNYANIIDQLGQTETFNKTGSKTIFVADDAAFERFFANNSWGVSSFAELTTAQKNILLKASMLDDAMLLDMLSASDANTTSEGTCMRRLTSLSTMDSIPLVTPEQMPKFNKYWDALRGKERNKSIRIAMDGTNPMMIHFLPDFLAKKGITEDDISFLLRKNGVQVKTYKKGEVYIYDKKVMASGVINDGFSDDTMTITCKNGYLYRLDDVLIPPSNMAAEIRQREDLSVLSRLFDRYCLPVYDENLTRNYNSITGETDSIFRLRYYTKSGGGGITIDNAILKDSERPENEDDVLDYDPGWNQYTPANTDVKADMAAILAPNDEAMLDYFTLGSGSVIIGAYAPGAVITDVESLKEVLDRIPDKLIAPLLNNLMQKSFVSTVPSRFDKITDDANDEIEGVKEAVTECVIANNGVVYIVNQVFGPTQYTAVAAPSLILDNMLIMRNVISQLGYNSFLLAKKAEYSLFLPDDKAFLYYDPVSIVKSRVSTSKPVLYELHYDAMHKTAAYNDKPYLYYKQYEFDINEDGSYTVDMSKDAVYNNDVIDFSVSNRKFFFPSGANMKLPSTPPLPFTTFMYNRMSDLIDNLIIVGDVTSGNKYYLTKGGNAVKVDFSNPSNPIFQGGEQVENGMKIAVKQAFEKQINGRSYNTVPADGLEAWTTKNSAIPTPATKSLYLQLSASAGEKQSPFYEFMNLASPDDFEGNVKVEDVMKKIFDSSDASVEDSIRAYSMFYSDAPTVFYGVPFFKGYNYTVYVPSNEAVKDMIAKGLPTWKDLNDCALGTSGGTKEQAAAALRLLSNVYRYHIQDNSVFVDNLPVNGAYETSYINTNGTYEVLNVNMTGGAMTITDKCGNTANVVADDATAENKTWNIICRDIEFKGAGSNNPFAIISSSASVAHQIDKVLCFEELFGYDGMVQRFAPGGEKVDTLFVEGMDGLYEAENGRKYYLVASKVNTFTAVDGKKYTTAGYLMEPKPKGQETKLSRERYIKDKDNAMVLITEEGYRVEEDTEGNMKLVLVTEVKTNSNGEEEEYRYVQKFENNGRTYEKVLLDIVPLTSAPEVETPEVE